MLNDKLSLKQKKKEERRVPKTRIQDLFFEISLKGGNGNTADLDENFVRIIEYEYAVKYLEYLGVRATQKNMEALLKSAPLYSCEIKSGWNNAGTLADVLYIYPYKPIKSEEFTDLEEETKDKEKKVSRKKQPFQLEIDQKYNMPLPKDDAPEGLKPGNEKAEEKKEIKTDANTKKDENAQPNDKDWLENKSSQEVEKVKEFGLNLNNLKKKYLFPYTLDSSLAIQKIHGPNINLLSTDEFEFPLILASNFPDIIKEIELPLKITIEELLKDLHLFVKEFPVKAIPHITENNEINDIIHTNLNRLIPSQKPIKSNATYGKSKPQIHIKDIYSVFVEIESKRMARLIGLVLHFAYWSLFGKANKLQIDEFHKRQMFLSIQKLANEIEKKFKSNKLYVSFIMPMIILTIRREADMVFKTRYPSFFENKEFNSIATTKLNDLITKLLDPNLFFSRLTFLESGRDAIDIKYKKAIVGKLPKIRDKFNTCSSLVNSVFPEKSEGKLRAMFSQKNIGEKEKKEVISESIRNAVNLGTDKAMMFEEDPKLTSANKLQMFKVMLEKINNQMKARNLKPIFNIGEK